MLRVCSFSALICFALWTSPGLAAAACLSLIHDVAAAPSHQDHAAGSDHDGAPDDCCVDLYTGGATAFTGALTGPTGSDQNHAIGSTGPALAQHPGRSPRPALLGRGPTAPGDGTGPPRVQRLFALHSAFLI